MIVLGIETSGLEGSVALVDHERLLEVRHLNQAGRRHAQALVFEIGELLKSHGIQPAKVSLVAVSKGPGSFTGLRVGMVCAKTFAYATGSQFASVDTFAAIATNVPDEIRRLRVIEDAQRDEFFVGEYYREGSSHWQQVAPIQIISSPLLLALQSDSDLVIGPGLKKLALGGARLRSLADPEVHRPRAAVIAMLGIDQITRGIGQPASPDTDFWRAVPFYLRLSAAEEKRELLATQGRPTGDSTSTVLNLNSSQPQPL